jgi:leucyl-tRNA synthetase
VAVNSRGPELVLDGLGRAEATERTVAWLEGSGSGRAAVSYRLRDWLFSRQRYWGEPFPIVYDETGLPLALPDSMLPVELPPMSDFRPRAGEDAEPRPPLARAQGFERVTLDLGDGPRPYRRETDVMPQWAGSCWYYLRYLDPDDDRRFVDPAVERYWMGGKRAGGVDLYIGGVEHAVLHLLYARFWHKVLFDLGHVSTPEPFQRLYNQGYILADAFTDPVGRYVPAAEVVEGRYQGRPVTRHVGKMGKSLKNGVSPDDIYEAYGADTLRLYEMAMGPLDADRPWRPDDIVGVYRFLQRLWRNVVDEDTGQARVSDTPLDGREPLYRQLHQTIDAVGSLYRELRYNVAVARLPELNHAVTGHARDRRRAAGADGGPAGPAPGRRAVGAARPRRPPGRRRLPRPRPAGPGHGDRRAPGHGRRAAPGRGHRGPRRRRGGGAPGRPGPSPGGPPGGRGPGGQGGPRPGPDRQRRHPPLSPVRMRAPAGCGPA